MTVKSVLVDRRNAHLIQEIATRMDKVPFVGFDIETHNGNAHQGLKNHKTNVFDIRRTVITGFSLYLEGEDSAYYFNLAHRDIENRLRLDEVTCLLDPNKLKIIHNAVFEKVMCKATWGLDIPKYIDTLQLAVSAYGPDNYPLEKLYTKDLGEIKKLLPAINKYFMSWDGHSELNPHQAELVGKVCGKQTDAAHSYNGWVKEIAYGYGLKKAVRSHFNYQMEEYQTVLDNCEYARTRQRVLKDKQLKKDYGIYFQEEPHMGHLTGEEVVSYGADDAYWCVMLYKRLISYIQENSPKALESFFIQENPMADIFANIQLKGLRIDRASVIKKRNEERKNVAQALRNIKRCFRELLPFEEKPNQALLEAEDWYKKNWFKYRQQIIDFANSPDYPEDDMKQILQLNGPIIKSYADTHEITNQKLGIINLVHYMPNRVIFYDLLAQKIIKKKGKVESGKDAKGVLKERFEKGNPIQLELLVNLNEISRIDQVCKLYLNPYLNLIDPETSRVYPNISSQLATRRMSMQNPNGQQLAKRGESTYVRGFYLPDYDDHLIVSCDWKQMELVIPGEFSADPEFLKVYGQHPFGDLHTVAAAAMLGTDEKTFREIKKQPEGTTEYKGILLQNSKREPLSPAKFTKWARTELGKGSNFSYLFSGALSEMQSKLGWTDEEHWDKVNSYRDKFSRFEEWRLGVIAHAVETGYTELPDGHKRVRFEATHRWADIMREKFLQAYDDQGVRNFLFKFIKLTQTRAKNQSVNAMVQGIAAALTKRALITLDKEIKKRWPEEKCRIMLPIHDEIVASVHKDILLEYNQLVRKVMCSHDWLFKNCVLEASVSVGRTFEPFHAKKAPLGQIELDEAPSLDWVPKKEWDGVMSEETVQKCIDYFFPKG